MKNLFDFATKELEQDAFLRWLFENWNEPDFYPLVHNILESFCKLDKDDRITKIETWGQWHNCDIKMDISTVHKPDIKLLIEDKTFSSEHSNQLVDYNNELNKESGEKHTIFYKTSKIFDDEAKRVEEAHWEMYDLDAIIKLFDPFKIKDVFLINQYIEHLFDLQSCQTYKDKPLHSISPKDLERWVAFFDNTIVPTLKPIATSFDCNIYVFKTRYNYSCITIERRHDEGKKVPYIEIRSRDCLSDNFKALVLCYGIDEHKIFKNLPAITEKAREGGFWDTKFQRHKPGKAPKQVCFYKSPHEVKTNEEFADEVRKCAVQYNELLKVWED